MSHRLLSLLIHRDRLTPIMTRYNSYYVIPNLQFTADGLLEKWIFVSGNDSPIKPYLPHFRVWRRVEDQGYVEVNGTHTLGLTPVKTQYLNVYEYILDSPAQVLEGDFIGFEQFHSNLTRHLPLLVNNTGYDLHLVSHLVNGRILGTKLLGLKYNPLFGVQMLGKAWCSEDSCIFYLSLTAAEVAPSVTTSTTVIETQQPTEVPDDMICGMIVILHSLT